MDGVAGDPVRMKGKELVSVLGGHSQSLHRREDAKTDVSWCAKLFSQRRRSHIEAMGARIFSCHPPVISLRLPQVSAHVLGPLQPVSPARQRSYQTSPQIDCG